MKRFVVPPERLTEPAITIDQPEELHHLRDVLRLKPGDRVVCFDGRGRECDGIIQRQSASQVVIDIVGSIRERQAALDLWLAPAVLKAEHFDWLVQKATELGATRISPLLTQRTVVRLTEEQRRRKQERWLRIARESAKQCGRATIPAIDVPVAFETALNTLKDAPLLLIPTLAVTTIPLGEVLNRVASLQQVAALIGPEGDFSREEVALAERYGARPVSLGRLTLRAETAAVAVLAMLSYALSESML